MLTKEWQNMPHGDPSHKRWKITTPVPLSRQLISSKYNGFCNKLHLSSFSLNKEWISVAHPEQQVERQPPVELINDDRLVTGVSVPPIRPLLPVGVWVMIHGPLRLARSSRSLQYMYHYIVVTRFLLHQ